MERMKKKPILKLFAADYTLLPLTPRIHKHVYTSTLYTHMHMYMYMYM